MQTIKKLSPTDEKYKIMTLGAAFDIGVGIIITVQYGENRYQAKMHGKTKGRIDGLGKLYKDTGLKEGDIVLAVWDYQTQTVVLSKQHDQTHSNLQSEGENCHLSQDEKYVEPETIKKDDVSKGSESWLDEDNEGMVHQQELEDVFTALDPVPHHWEFYFGSNSALKNTRANNEWILYKDEVNCRLLFITESDGTVVEEVLSSKYQYEVLLGFNGYGIWFALYGTGQTWDGYPWINRIVCIDYVNKEERVFKINQKKGNLKIENIYIYGNEFFYFCQESGHTETAYRVNANGEQKILSLKLRDDGSQKIRRVIAGAEHYAVLMDTDYYDEDEGLQIVSVCRVYKKSSGEMENEIKTMSQIKTIDFERDIAITVASAIDYVHILAETASSKPEGMEWWVAKPLFNNPRLERMGTFKKSGKPAAFMIPKERELLYVDFRRCYTAPHYSILKRFNGNGDSVRLSGVGHGETERILVTRQYLFCDYDASGISRLPLDFDEYEGYAQDNPEAFMFLKQYAGIKKWS